MTRKYEKRDHYKTNTRIAKCGHESSQGRWLKCEECMPNLPEESDWDYMGEACDLTDEE